MLLSKSSATPLDSSSDDVDFNIHKTLILSETLPSWYYDDNNNNTVERADIIITHPLEESKVRKLAEVKV